MTLREFWNTYSGVVNFVNRKGKTVDDMDYPLDTKVKDIRHIKEDQYEVRLDCE